MQDADPYWNLWVEVERPSSECSAEGGAEGAAGGALGLHLELHNSYLLVGYWMVMIWVSCHLALKPWLVLNRWACPTSLCDP